ncbi:MAG: ABC transporter ATP-binding protein, partial [Hungatella sp.]
MKHKNTGSIVVRTLLKNPWMSGVLLVVTLLVVVLNLTPPQLLRLIIDRNLIPQNRDGLWNLALLYLLVTVFIGVFDFLKSGVLVIFGQKIVKQIRMEMNGKLQRLGMQYFTK